MKNQKLSNAIAGICLLSCLVSCGGGGSGSNEPASENPVPAAVARSPILKLAFSQGGEDKAYTEENGMKVVSMSKAPFQIRFPEQTLGSVYIRATPVNSGGPYYGGGNIMARYSGTLIVVPDGDNSINEYKYSETVASGTDRALNITEILDRWSGTTSASVLYLQFSRPTGTGNTTETIKLRFN